jgi:hypothetical protein
MFNIGDIVVHNLHEDRFGIVVEINKNTITVEWFRENQKYKYYPHEIAKVSE